MIALLPIAYSTGTSDINELGRDSPVIKVIHTKYWLTIDDRYIKHVKLDRPIFFS